MAKTVQKEIKETPGIRNLPPANKVKIIYGAGSVRLEANGEIAGFEISYRGAFHGVNKMGSGWAMSVGGNKIIIYSLAKKRAPELLFKYVGDLRIVSVKYADWNNSMKFADIENVNKNDWNVIDGDWASYARKYEEVETIRVIYKSVLKSMI